MTPSNEVTVEDVISKTSYVKNNLETLLNYLHPTFHCMKLIIKVLIHGPDGSGKRILAKLTARNLNIKFQEEQVVDLLDDNVLGTEKKIKAALSKCTSLAPCLIYLTGYELFCSLEDPDLDRIEYLIRETLDDISNAATQPIILLAATNDFDRVYKTPLSAVFQYEIKLKSPTKAQAKEILQAIAQEAGLNSNPERELDLLSNNDEYYIGNLMHLVALSELKYYKQTTLGEAQTDELERSKTGQEGSRWLDVGGLGHIKEAIIDTIQLSIDYPQLRKTGLRRTGVLLYGPPGTGKTLLAKAVATECGLNFINVKGPELLNEYVGQSEDNVRKLFQKARDSSPSVIFFDEIDSLAPNRGQAGDSGGVMDRMVSQLLAEMDGVGKSDCVFVIGATNRVDLVDPSLLRPGRFDKVLEVPLPSSHEDRLQILQALTRKMKLADDVDLTKLELLAPSSISGAEFQGICSRAMHKAFDRAIHLVESGQMKEDDVEIVASMNDFLGSI